MSTRLLPTSAIRVMLLGSETSTNVYRSRFAARGSEDGGAHLPPERPAAWRLVQVPHHHHHTRAWHVAHVPIERRLVAVRRSPARADGCGRSVADHRRELWEKAADVHRHVALIPRPDRKGLDGVAQGGRVESLQRVEDLGPSVRQ